MKRMVNEGTATSGNFGHKGRPGMSGGSCGKTKKLGYSPTKVKDIKRKSAFIKQVKLPLVRRGR